MQIRDHNEMILIFQVCRHIEEIICYKWVHFGAIPCTNESINSGKMSNVFVVFRAVSIIYVNLWANTRSQRNEFNVPGL